ncbi:hypothetical protein C8J57DRAFT_1413236 [Mycena rebaudengoi]|nr:hypothetical protein C8J57DRAFT_1413236 [Mycena rebaudengoi]
MPKAPCRFYAKGNCRNGQECEYSHSRDAPPSQASTNESPNPRQVPLPPAPQGVCRSYWGKGNCRFEFNCRFKHEQFSENSPRPTASSWPGRPSSSSFSADRGSLSPARFLTEGGLAKLNGSGTDVFFAPPNNPRSPNEIHNHLKKFLHDQFRFQNPADVYAFLSLLESLDTSGPLWAPEDGPLLLTSLATGNGLLRIGDIFRWPSISSRTTFSRLDLSFQRAYVPLLKFYSSEFVVKSTLNHLINGLYMCILDNIENFIDNLEKCMQECMDARSFNSAFSHSHGVGNVGIQVISSLAVILFEILTRFKNAAAKYPKIVPVVQRLQGWTDTWIEGISMSPPSFDDPFKAVSSTARDQILNHLRAKISRLVRIVDREQDRIDRSKQQHPAASFGTVDGLDEGVAAALHITYEGPGELRELGPRHDNDFSDITDIRVAPTHEELVSRLSPFLPGNFHDAPHHLPAASMERLLDIQFRLLREELTAPLRTSVQLVYEDLQSTAPKTTLSQLIEQRGGKYRGHVEGHDQVMFNVYTNIEFSPLSPDWRGLSVGLTVDSPPGRARQPQAKVRAAFWEGMSGKRLMQGGLVALVWKTGNTIDVHLGILASSLKSLVDSAKEVTGSSRVSVRVVFFDPAVEIRILNSLKHHHGSQLGTRVLVEAPVMFEAIRPFLEALRAEPESLPFAQYLVHRPRGVLAAMEISPPRYALVPGFTYQLASLFPPEAGIGDLKLNVTDPASVEFARGQLKTSSRLDPSQCEAVVDTLTREVSLIQGPPGTGKSYTGVEILRVLLANRVGPVLLIAFTNHALDHMLTSVLDAGITNKIVRLGSRSADERISQYSMENIEMVAGGSRLDQSFRQHYRNLKTVQEEIKRLMNKFLQVEITSEECIKFLQIQYAEHFEQLWYPPMWIKNLREISRDIDDSPWMRAGKRGKADVVDDTIYTYWRDGGDLDFLNSSVHRQPGIDSQPVASQNRFDVLPEAEPESDSEYASASEHHVTRLNTKSDEDDDGSSDEEDIPEHSWQKDDWPADPDHLNAFEIPNAVPVSDNRPSSPDFELPSESPTQSPLQIHDLQNPMAFFGGPIPTIPDSMNRPLGTLLEEGIMWTLSRRERDRLHKHWLTEIRERLHEDQLQDFQSLRDKHASVLQKHQEGKDETRRQLLNHIDIIGCTTTGAAKLASLLKSIAPRIMLVEEAGQVLEAHILGSLVPSVEHLILIGDPLQLRPTLNNYALSMDNKRGKQLFKFDMSLMERLATNGLSMSQLNVQRRMRPTISTLIRDTLYHRLVDHELVKKYPDVRGLSRNIFFLSHDHRENGGAEESASKYNTFEVDMIKDLVLHLLRQGCYSEEGDIVVLCAYLGQLARVRDALSNEVAVVIDGRDKENLAEQEEEKLEDDSQVEHVKVTTRVRLRTIDNYQGEEAKIVILSTVRNAGLRPEDQDHHFGRPTIGFLRSENRTNVALSRAKEGLFIMGNASQLASRSPMWRKIIEHLEETDSLGPGFPISCHQHPDKIELISEPGKLRMFAPDGGCFESCNYRLNCGHVCPYKCHPDDPKHKFVACPQPCRRLCSRNHPCRKECSQDCGKCLFKVPDVELPCGHRVRSIECYRLDDLDGVLCTELVTKELPQCEHSMNMMCSSEPSQASCTSVCGGTMACCGRPCNSKCHQCLQVNRQPLEADENQLPAIKVARIQHVEHPCQKPLFCAHSCSKPCSTDHKCTTICQQECRQQCLHSRCTNYCSTPCSPCQNPCTWICPHHKCPLPCGSICARLPCDKRCPKTLHCGHTCPSVCGEDCSVQICPTCAPDALKQNVVDFLLYRKLEDIDSTGDTLDELLITLPKCKHIFTVETLDGHCVMGDFYTREGAEGKWLGLRSPDASGETRGPPVCPTCRTAITSPRYSRIFKSADLGVLERNVISRMTLSLNRLQMSMAGVRKSSMEEALQRASRSLNIPSNPASTRKKQRTKARRKALATSQDSPVPLETLLPSNSTLHSLSSIISGIWERTTQPLTKMYADALKVAKTRSAHIHAWESAFSSLYEQEIDLALSDPVRAPRRPEEHAMRMARMKVGQPQPRADKRFLVEAFWATLKLRFILCDLARTWMKELMDKSTTFAPEERQKWGLYGFFIIDSCVHDADIAYTIAEMSESRRQMTITTLLLMRASFERFRFDLDMCRASDKFQEDRARLLEDISKEREKAEAQFERTVTEHIAVLRNDAQGWISDNFSETARIILDDWKKLEQSLRADTFYEPVSLDERMAVVRALNFTHTGHFYTCVNGHVYVIDDCGGAMQQSNCPECGASIGGSNHTLDSTNAPAREFENMARAAGAAPSPWEWIRL